MIKVLRDHLPYQSFSRLVATAWQGSLKKFKVGYSFLRSHTFFHLPQAQWDLRLWRSLDTDSVASFQRQWRGLACTASTRPATRLVAWGIAGAASRRPVASLSLSLSLSILLLKKSATGLLHRSIHMWMFSVERRPSTFTSSSYKWVYVQSNGNRNW